MIHLHRSILGASSRVSKVDRRTEVPRRAAPFAIVLSLLLATGCAPMSFLITPVQDAYDLEERVVLRERPWATRKVAVVDINGVITDRGSSPLLGPPGPNPVAVFKHKLDKARKDDSVKAVLLRINSPGGGVTASDLMHHEVREFRKQSGKPVVACLMDVAASGGYYVACAADEIHALPTTTTGSIGVIMMTPELSGIMQKLGIRVNVIKSGEMKDAGSPFREMSDKDRTLYQTLINGMYERFLAVVLAGRPGLTEQKLRELADGRVYSAEQARAAGLIDNVGTLDGAIAATKRRAGLADASVLVVEYAPSYAYRPNYYAESAARDRPERASIINLELPEWLTGQGPHFLYLWEPGF